MRYKGEKLGGESVSVTLVDRELNVGYLVSAYNKNVGNCFWQVSMKRGHLKCLRLRYRIIEEIQRRKAERRRECVSYCCR